ncbi:MAG: hypothetical protein JSW58_06790 [Candidatus Latescibacterota bacterium]|nr:MAG: hypothetical protein JSW58_06790 [Candidatus Latescibacterota bacterium]
MGGAFVSVADDPAATVINPAGLTQVTSIGFLSSFSNPYGLSDLSEGFVAAAIPTRIGSFGLSWHRFALKDVTAEDLFTLSYGRDLIRRAQGASLSVGAGIDAARVSYDTYSDAKTAVTGSFAVLLRPFPIIGVGYTVRNIGEPSFDWVAGGGTSRLEMTHAFGFAYHWNRTFSVLYQRERGQDGVWRDRLGLEVFAGEKLRVRTGLAEGDVTGGLSVVISRVIIDAGVSAHEELGLSYLVSVGVSLPSTSKEKGEEW